MCDQLEKSFYTSYKNIEYAFENLRQIQTYHYFNELVKIIVQIVFSLNILKFHSKKPNNKAVFF